MPRNSIKPRERRPFPSELPQKPPQTAPSESLSPAEAQQLQQYVLEQVAQSASVCRKIEQQLRENPATELDTIIQLHRTLILDLSAKVSSAPELLGLISSLLKPVMDWAHLEEKRADRELARQKHQDQMAAQQAASEKKQGDSSKPLSDPTLEKIERELTLF